MRRRVLGVLTQHLAGSRIGDVLGRNEQSELQYDELVKADQVTIAMLHIFVMERMVEQA
jgi:hypothetical protein